MLYGRFAESKPLAGQWVDPLPDEKVYDQMLKSKYISSKSES